MAQISERTDTPLDLLFFAQCRVFPHSFRCVRQCTRESVTVQESTMVGVQRRLEQVRQQGDRRSRAPSQQILEEIESAVCPPAVQEPSPYPDCRSDHRMFLTVWHLKPPLLSQSKAQNAPAPFDTHNWNCISFEGRGLETTESCADSETSLRCP